MFLVTSVTMLDGRSPDQDVERLTRRMRESRGSRETPSPLAFAGLAAACRRRSSSPRVQREGAPGSTSPGRAPRPWRRAMLNALSTRRDGLGPRLSRLATTGPGDVQFVCLRSSAPRTPARACSCRATRWRACSTRSRERHPADDLRLQPLADVARGHDLAPRPPGAVTLRVSPCRDRRIGTLHAGRRYPFATSCRSTWAGCRRGGK